jgi:hypothetical protein
MRRPRGIGEGGVEDEALEKSVELIRHMPRKQQECVPLSPKAANTRPSHEILLCEWRDTQ